MTAATREPLRIGIGGPVGSGKTALMDWLCKSMRSRFELVAIGLDSWAYHLWQTAPSNGWDS